MSAWLAAGWLGATGWAHNPHDTVTALAVSPDPLDPRAWITRLPSANWRLLELAESGDGGVSWGPVRGLPDPEDLLGVAVSPGFGQDHTAIAWSHGTGWVSTDGAATWWPLQGAGAPIDRVAVTLGAEGGPVVWVEAAGRLRRSVDLGERWDEVADGVTTFGVPPDARVDDRVYVAEGAVVRESRDGGGSWVEVAAVDGWARALVVPAGSAGDLFVGHSRGLARRVGGGAAEAVDAFEGLPVEVVATSPQWPEDPTVWVATDREGPFRSPDGGGSWVAPTLTPSLSDQTTLHYRAIGFSGDFDRDRTMYLALFEGLFVTGDGGETWVERDTRPPDLVNELALSPGFAVDASLVVGTYDGGAYVSEDGGERFTAVATGLLHSSVYAVEWTEDGGGSVVFAGLRAGLGAWQPKTDRAWRNHPTPFEFPTRIEASPAFALDGVLFAGTRTEGVHRSGDAGRTWAPVLPHAGPTSSVAVSPGFATDGVAVVSTMRDGLWRSADGGTSWEVVPFEPAWAHLAFDGDALTPTLLAASADGAWRSTDLGRTFTRVESAGPGPLEAVASAGARTWFVSRRGGGLLRSDDGGVTFTTLGDLAPAELAASPGFDADGVVFGSELGAVWRSDDRGASWRRIDPDPIRYEETTQAVEVGPKLRDEDDLSCRGAALIDPAHPARLRFVGTRLAAVGDRGPGAGSGTLRVDGVVVAFDAWSSRDAHEQVLVEVAGLPPGEHAAELLVADGVVVLDAFEVGAPEPPPGPGASGDTGGPGWELPETRSRAAPAEGCGCGSSPAPAAAAWSAVLVVARRRFGGPTRT